MEGLTELQILTSQIGWTGPKVLTSQKGLTGPEELEIPKGCQRREGCEAVKSIDHPVRQLKGLNISKGYQRIDGIDEIADLKELEIPKDRQDYWCQGREGCDAIDKNKIR